MEEQKQARSATFNPERNEDSCNILELPTEFLERFPVTEGQMYFKTLCERCYDDETWRYYFRFARADLFAFAEELRTAREKPRVRDFRDLKMASERPDKQRKPKLQKRSLNYVAELALFLLRMAHGLDYKIVSLFFGLRGAGSGAHHIFQHVTQAILDFEDVVWPDREERETLKAKVGNRFPQFEGAVGFIDGTRLAIKRPENFMGSELNGHQAGSTGDFVRLQRPFWNGYYKGHCYNNLCVFDPTGKIIFASVGAAGRQNDQSMWTDCPLARESSRFFSDGEYILADSGYGVETHIMPPIPDVLNESVVHSLHMAVRHNQFHARARIAAEWGFGSLKGIWKIMQIPSFKSQYWNHINIIWCSILLHNRLTVLYGNSISSYYNLSVDEVDRDYFDEG
eukprot:GILJ01008769.1.p1 GENE.GILJ01008769.1~~GILJ01008769.1.p1  ORF type:complete len:397 (-),score=19.39 GILJ01008769.1:125-1315(-)